MKIKIRSHLWLGLILAGLSGCLTPMTDKPAAPVREVKEMPKAIVNESAPKKRLMILPFLDANETHPVSLRDHARADFITELNRAGQLIVVDSGDLKIDFTKAMKGGEFQFAEVGKAASELGVAALLEGKIIDLKVTRTADPVGLFRQVKTKFEAVVRVRLALARSGKEVFNTTKSVSLEESGTRVAQATTADRLIQTNPEVIEKLVTDAFLDFQTQIFAALAKLSWEGRIALVNGERIFLNVGRISGVNLGDVLRVTEEGEEVFDPQTGGFIGKSPGRLKGTIEVISYFGQDGAVAVVHSGAGFKENDRVEQY